MTAMQLAFERIELMEIVDKDSTHWQMFKEHYLEKEKEQIIEAHAFGADDVNFNGEINVRGFSDGEYYYNETYQNK